MRCVFYIAFDWSHAFQIASDVLSLLWRFKAYIAFVFSYAFQIAGAILLLLWSLKGIQKNILDLYFSESAFIQRNDNNTCTLCKEKLQKETRTIALNMIAFLNIIVGYLLAIFGEKHFPEWVSFSLIIGLTVIISALEYGIAFLVAKFKYPKDIEVPYDLLSNREIIFTPTERQIEEAVKQMGIEEMVQSTWDEVFKEDKHNE